jgi:hypothetical protein
MYFDLFLPFSSPATADAPTKKSKGKGKAAAPQAAPAGAASKARPETCWDGVDVEGREDFARRLGLAGHRESYYSTASRYSHLRHVVQMRKLRGTKANGTSGIQCRCAYSHPRGRIDSLAITFPYPSIPSSRPPPKTYISVVLVDRGKQWRVIHCSCKRAEYSASDSIPFQTGRRQDTSPGTPSRCSRDRFNTSAAHVYGSREQRDSSRTALI